MTDLQEAYEQAYEDYVPAYPPEHNNNRCHNCDMPFVPEQWDERHINTPDTMGETCEECGWTGNSTDPITGAKLLSTYDGRMLCSSCRVDQRLKDGDYSNEVR